jgi:hypothetical protein
VLAAPRRERARLRLLGYANGLKAQTPQMLAARRVNAPHAPRSPRRYLLPPVGAERPATLVGNVQQRVLHYRIAEAFEGAVAAALAVPQTGSLQAQLHARRQAAERHLHSALGQLGIDATGLRLPPPPAVGDIMDGAGSLAG